MGKGRQIYVCRAVRPRASFTIRSIAAGQNTAWIGIDIAAAQQLLDMYGKLDRIEASLDQVEHAERDGSID